MNFYSVSTGNVNITGTSIDVTSGNSFYKLISTNTTFSFANTGSLTKTITVYVGADYSSGLSTASYTVTFSGISGVVPSTINVTSSAPKKFVFSITSGSVALTSISSMPLSGREIDGLSLTLNGSVNSSVVQNNNLYIGGDFTTVYTEKQSQPYVSALSTTSGRPDAQIGDFINKFNAQVNAMIRSGNYLYCAGAFTSYNSTSVPKLVKIDLTTGLPDSTFNSNIGLGPNATVTSMVMDSSNNLYFVGSSIISFNGTARSCIVKISSSGVLDTTFAPGTFVGGNPTILAIDSSGLYASGGAFGTYGGVSRAGVVKMSTTNAALDTNFSIGTTSTTLSQILLDGLGNLFACGSFTSTPNSTVRGRIAKFNSTTGNPDATFAPITGFSGIVNSIALDGSGNLYCGGNFTSYTAPSASAVTIYRLAKISATTAALDTTFNVGSVGFNSAANGVISLAYDSTNNALYCGGDFTTYKNEQAYYVAKLNGTTAARDSFFSAGFDVRAQAVYFDSTAGLLYYMGNTAGAMNYFSSYSSAARIAKINLSTQLLDMKFCLGATTGFNGTVNSLALDASGNLYVGGAFTQYKGVAKSYLAKVDAYSGLVITWSPTLTGFTTVTAIKLTTSNGSIYVAGNYIAKYSASTAATTWGPTALTSGQVNCIEVDTSDNAYIGGTFVYGGKTYLAKLVSATGAVDATFATAAFSSLGYVYSLNYDSSSSSLYCAGDFTSYNGVGTTYRLLKVSSTNATMDTTFNSGMSDGYSATAYAVARDSSGYVYYGTTSGIVKLDKTTGAFQSKAASSGGTAGAKTISVDATNYRLIVGGDFTAYKTSANHGYLLGVNQSTLDIRKSLPVNMNRFNESVTYVLLNSGTSYTLPANAYRLKVWAIGGGGAGGGVSTTDATTAGGGAAGCILVRTFAVTGGQKITYAIGSGGTGSATAATGGAGGTTSVTVGSTSIYANGGYGGFFNTAGSSTGGTTDYLTVIDNYYVGGTGAGLTGDNGGGGGGAIGTVAGSTNLTVGGNGGQSIDVAGLADAIYRASSLSLVGSGAGSPAGSLATGNANNGGDATGFGCGGGGAGYWGGSGGNGYYGGGGGGASAYTVAKAGGNGGSGCVVLMITSVS
jgi:hypothetical protein